MRRPTRLKEKQDMKSRGFRRGPAGARFRRHAASALLGLALAAGTLAGLPAVAADQSSIRISDSDGASSRRVDLGLGKSIIVDLPRDAKEVFVANPAIANAVVRSARKVFVIAAAAGQTSIFFMDANGTQIGAIDVNVQRDTNPIAAAIREAMPDSQVNVQQLNDGVLLTGSVGSAQDAQQAASIAAKYTGKPELVSNSISIRGGDQVMLKVTVAEVQREVLKQLGVNVSGSFEIANKIIQFATDNPFPLATQALTTGGAQIGGTPNQGGLDPVSPTSPLGMHGSTFRAFERTGVMKTLAEPTLTAISGESAHFLAGGEVPTPKGQTCDQNGCTISIEYKPVGVSLNFTPVVLRESRISLRVYTEVTELDYQNTIVFNSVNVPSFRTRKADTTVDIPSGGSLVMAGLIQNSNQQVVNGTPGLMNIPVLGQLFRSRDYQRHETELMIVVTPYIAKPVERNDLSLPTDGFADASDPSAWLLGRVNRIYGVKGAVVPNVKLNGRYGFIVD
jgi:pilus assembly protein CpaC